MKYIKIFEDFSGSARSQMYDKIITIKDLLSDISDDGIEVSVEKRGGFIDIEIGQFVEITPSSIRGFNLLYIDKFYKWNDIKDCIINMYNYLESLDLKFIQLLIIDSTSRIGRTHTFRSPIGSHNWSIPSILNDPSGCCCCDRCQTGIGFVEIKRTIISIKSIPISEPFSTDNYKISPKLGF